MRSKLIWLVLASTLVVGACGGGDDDGASADRLSMEDPWARPTPPGADVAAFYVIVRNGTDTDDVLIGAASDRCPKAEIHRTSMEDGVMSMGPATEEERTVPSGGSLSLEPRGLHVMCMGLADSLVAGESVELQLVFDRAGTLDLAAVVEDR